VELYTLNRRFLKQETIDEFDSVIWTDRYYGDGEVELVVPATKLMMQHLKVGTFLMLNGSDEPMILETYGIEKGKLKVTGITLCKWLNNRFVRTSAPHQDRYWQAGVQPPGWLMATILWYMVIDGPFLDGTIPTGISNPGIFRIPGLVAYDFDKTGAPITVAVPYGPLYDALREIATTYQIGMQIKLDHADDSGYQLSYRTYRGTDRTSQNPGRDPVRFSPLMDSLTEIKELESISGYKTNVWSYAPANPGELATTPGYDGRVTPGGAYTGFDLRAMLYFAEDLTTDMVNGDPAVLLQLLTSRARDALASNNFVKVVDGEVVPNVQFKYGQDYFLGDVIELQGNSGMVQNARVTEYIRVQDVEGERAYPTVSVIE
jgi:hypothetical protein